MRTRWHDLEGRGRVQARLKLPLCLTDLETARFAIAWLHRPHTTNASSARNTKNCPPRWESPPCPTWNFANGISPFWEHRPQESFKQVFSVHRILLLLFFSLLNVSLGVTRSDKRRDVRACIGRFFNFYIFRSFVHSTVVTSELNILVRSWRNSKVSYIQWIRIDIFSSCIRLRILRLQLKTMIGNWKKLDARSFSF